MDYLDITMGSKAEAMLAVPGAPEAVECRWKASGAESLLALCDLAPE